MASSSLASAAALLSPLPVLVSAPGAALSPRAARIGRKGDAPTEGVEMPSLSRPDEATRRQSASSGLMPALVSAPGADAALLLPLTALLSAPDAALSPRSRRLVRFGPRLSVPRAERWGEARLSVDR